jgi:hypothetical protein
LLIARRWRARGPHAWFDVLETTPDYDLIAHQDPGFEFDEHLFW